MSAPLQPPKKQSSDCGGDGPNGFNDFKEVNQALLELRSVVDEQFARQTNMLLDLTLQVTELHVAGNSFFRQMSADSHAADGTGVESPVPATPMTESMAMEGFKKLPAPPVATKGGHLAPLPPVVKTHSKSSEARASRASRMFLENVAENADLPAQSDEMSQKEMRKSTQNEIFAMKAEVRKTFLETVTAFVFAEQVPADMKGNTCASRIVSSKAFAVVIASLIFLNLVMLGAEVDASATLPLHVQLESFYVLNNFVVGIFVMEVILKLLAYTCRGFFSGSDRAWNIFDFLIVVLSVIEILADLLAQALSDMQFMDISHLRVMRFARLVRALRGIRVIRMLRYISGLRTILFSIVSTASAVLWTMALLIMVFFCFGVLLAQIVTDHCRTQLQADLLCDPSLVQFWRSVGESMLTLFLSITGGISWLEALAPLREFSAFASCAYVLYIVVAVFAILNVVTGVFCNMAIESARADKDMAILQQIRKHEAQVESLRELFKEIDNDGSSVLSLPELKEALQTENMANFMKSLDIATQDVWTLFTVIDADGSGEITLDEFVFGCMHLQGPAKGVQMARLQHETTILRKEMKIVRKNLDRLKASFTIADRQSRLSNAPRNTYTKTARDSL